MSAQTTPESISSPEAVKYWVVSAAEPGVLPRLMEVFAKRGLIPYRWISVLVDQMLHIDIEIPATDTHEALRIAAAMRGVIGVETVLAAGDQASLAG